VSLGGGRLRGDTGQIVQADLNLMLLGVSQDKGPVFRWHDSVTAVGGNPTANSPRRNRTDGSCVHNAPAFKHYAIGGFRPPLDESHVNFPVEPASLGGIIILATGNFIKINIAYR
jgi:hypothetical protein